MAKRKEHCVTPSVLPLVSITPLTIHQHQTFTAWASGQHLLLTGDAGTGKTFISLYLALKEALKKDSLYEQVIIIRSIVPSREIGYLPGSLKEKIGVYEDPYRMICNQLLSRDDGYDRLKCQGQLNFQTTSYLRGMTLDRCIVIVDEIQNLSYQELTTVVTRFGSDCRIIFCGDPCQSDLWHRDDRQGVSHFMQIVESMPSVETIRFTVQDVVRSGFVKEFLYAASAYHAQSSPTYCTV